MTTPAQRLAGFAVDLTFDAIPEAVVERAKACIIDTIAVTTYGATLPWSKIVIDYAYKNSAPGNATIWGTDLRVRAPFAALANGTLAHACEFDCTYDPSVHAHSGAALISPALALAQTHGKSGKDLIVAFVAASEVLHRIGDAGNRSIEKLGFHAPGLNGVFAGVIASGRLLDLNLNQMTNALGIGGSLCSGLMECVKTGGGMVKHLHIGRAAESGVTAATLAHEGFTGPSSRFEGEFGFLNAYCRDAKAPARLTAGLGEEWRTLRILHKYYPMHTMAQPPVTAVLELKAQHGISGEDIASILLEAGPTIVSHHDIPEPQDIMMAQFSTPFLLALVFYADPRHPNVFSDETLNDTAIRALCRKVRIEALKDMRSQKACRVTITMKDGRRLVKEKDDFPGMPRCPFTRTQLREKYDMLTKAFSPESADYIFRQFEMLETVQDMSSLHLTCDDRHKSATKS